MNGSSVEASFSVEQINDARDLEYVGLFLGTANIVDEIYNEASTTQGGDQVTFGDTKTLVIDLSNNQLGERENVFVRIGLKVVGKSELLFSQVYNIEL